MQFIARKRRQTPPVIIISLIDVLIVMLIFLMVTTTFKQTPPIKITLPESNQTPPKTGASEQTLIVTIDKKEPYFYLRDRPVTIDNLKEQLREAMRKNPNASVSIRPDTRAEAGQLIKVLDVVREVGIRATVPVFTKPPGAR